MEWVEEEVTKVVVQQAVMVAEEVVVEAKAARTAGAAVAPKPMTADLIDWRQTASLWNGSAKRGRRMYAERSAMLAMQPRMKKAATAPKETKMVSRSCSSSCEGRQAEEGSV